MAQSESEPKLTPQASERNAWLFLDKLSKDVEMRERVYRLFKKLTPGDWTAFAQLGVAEGYQFTGQQLKEVMPDTFYEGRRAGWKTAVVTEEHMPFEDEDQPYRRPGRYPGRAVLDLGDPDPEPPLS